MRKKKDIEIRITNFLTVWHQKVLCYWSILAAPPLIGPLDLACLMSADTLPAKVWTFFGFYIFVTFPLDGGWAGKRKQKQYSNVFRIKQNLSPEI